MDGPTLLSLLRHETCRATGCTEIAAAALAAARAVEALGTPTRTLHLAVSSNVYKNGAYAAVPGCPLRGLAAAAALGATIGESSSGLAILDTATPFRVAAAKRLLARETVLFSTLWTR